MLGAVTAQEAIGELNASVTKAPAETSALDAWLVESNKMCGSDGECKRIAKKYFDDAVACNGGNATACSARDPNVSEIDRWNAQRKNLPSQVAPQDALMQCLQDQANRVAQSCLKENDCRGLSRMVRRAQQMNCGYSAIDSDKPIQQPQSTWQPVDSPSRSQMPSTQPERSSNTGLYDPGCMSICLNSKYAFAFCQIQCRQR